jgi:nucleotide-binding universal stress UspA family protein
MYRQILVANDGSDGAARALAVAPCHLLVVK